MPELSYRGLPRISSCANLTTAFVCLIKPCSPLSWSGWYFPVEEEGLIKLRSWVSLKRLETWTLISSEEIFESSAAKTFALSNVTEAGPLISSFFTLFSGLNKDSKKSLTVKNSETTPFIGK